MSGLGAAQGATAVIGRQLGPYRILSALGAGGMGEVYRARDSKLGRDVAIKLLPPRFTADPSAAPDWLVKRACSPPSTIHTSARSIGLEEIDGATALVLELVEGTTLAARLERGPVAIGYALAVARQVADALDAAHQKHIIHRDLKPANIMLHGEAGSTATDPRVKVLDFGLATTGLADRGMIRTR